MNKNEIIKRQISILFLILLAITIIPIVSSGITYPTLTGYVTDNANIITPEYRQKITELAENINKNTTVDIAVLTIQSLEGDTPENYALNVFRQNGVGKKDNNNGLLILVAKDDRKYKFEGTIPDAMKVPIGDKIITPNFRNGDYGKGIYESMLVIEGLVTNNTEVLSKYGLTDQPAEMPVWVIILVVIIIIILIVVVIAATDGGGGGNSSGGGWGGSGGGGDSGGGDSGFGGFGGGSSGGGGFGGGW